MAKPINSSSIAAPGFLGLNLQESSIQLASGFALVAQNCVIDRYGRVGARKGWTPVNSSVNTDLGAANPVEFIFEMVTSGSGDTISAGNNKLFTGTTTMTTKTVRNADNSGNATYTITGNNWQGASLPYGDGSDAQAHTYLVQVGHSPLVYHELPVSGGDPHDHDSGTFGFQQLGDVGTLPPGYSTADFKPNCALAAYGRIWMADIVGDRQTVYFSRLLDGSDFSGGDSGSLSLNAVFPNNDQIIALAAHNGFLIIFGRNNIAIYANPIDVTELTLAEFIPNVGCIARDSVVSTGTDIIFLSDAGVRSLQRVIQEKSLPFRDLSKNVRDELISNVASETATNIKAVYYDRDAFYLLSLPSTKFIYCFDTRSSLQDGSARVTIWDSIEPNAFFVNSAKQLLIGKPGYIGRYSGYTDNSSIYRFKYFTNYFDFDQPTSLKFLKRIGFTVIGGSNEQLAIKYGFDYTENYLAVTKTLDTGLISEYNVAQYTDPADENDDEAVAAFYSGGIVLSKFVINASGNGTVLQIGLEADINSDPLSIQKIDVFVKQGKTV
jgi:hypothetical protein